MAQLQAGDWLIAAKLDRLFRSAEHALVVARELQERKVHLILVDLGSDPVTGNGISKLFFTLLAAIAEFERTRVLERMNEGRAGKAKRGGHIGGDAPYGYRVEGAGKAARLVEDPIEQRVVGKICKLRADGVPFRSVCRALTDQGILNRVGKPFEAMQIQRIVKHAQRNAEAARWGSPSTSALPGVGDRNRSIGCRWRRKDSFGRLSIGRSASTGRRDADKKKRFEGDFMNINHTPGPWAVDWSDDGPLIYTGDLLIASVSGSTEHIEVQGLDEQTTEANALLMTAAPDLLEALDLLLEHADWTESVSDLERELSLTVDHAEQERIKRDIARAKVVDQARVAIAKAKGA
jgi:DNA invertase Pin-like site-specific DNA recombinase